MIDFDYIISKPLSEKEQKEVEKSFKIKKTKKYEILSCPNIKSKNDFFKENDNGLVNFKNIKNQEENK